ncbi:MAG: hypothetical protein ABIP71_02180 [Verrucomicrobiota bacterium]
MKLRANRGLFQGRAGFLRLQRTRRITPLREKDYLKAWALYVFCATTCGFLAGAITGSIAGAILAVLGKSESVIKMVSAVVGFFSGLPLSYMFFRIFVIRYLVEKVMHPAAPVEAVHLS